MSEFAFAPAVRQNTPMIIAIAGSSGSGKTFTALELAMGLAEGAKIALIDTEGRRGLHYADLATNGRPRFAFDHCDFRAPYTPARYLAVLKQAETAGYPVIVIDSFSDEYVGEGGLVDMAFEEEKRVHNTAASWARPKAQHKLVIRWLRQSRCHVIFCIRAEEKVRLEQVDRDGRKQTVVVPIGWQPITEKNTMYDMTTSFMLHPDAPGVPHPIKLQEQHRSFFPAGQPVTREAGRALAAWCAGGQSLPLAGPGAVAHAAEQLTVAAWKAADDGLFALQKFWTGLQKAQRTSLGAETLAELQLHAKLRDEERERKDAEERGYDPDEYEPQPDHREVRDPADYLGA